MRKIGININAVSGIGDAEYIRMIRDLGFTATFTGAMDPERLKNIAAACESSGVVCETLHAPFGHINDIWLPGEGGDTMLEELKTCVDNCGIVGADIAVVHLSSGNTPPSITDLGRARFDSLLEYAAGKNVLIAFENQRKLANLAWALETYGEQVAGFCWDCGHEGCFTPGKQYMPLFGDRLICTHIHDNSGVWNSDDHMLPFDGALDFERIAAQISGSPFKGTLMLEVSAKKDGRYADMTPEQYLQRAALAASKLRDMVEPDHDK